MRILRQLWLALSLLLAATGCGAAHDPNPDSPADDIARTRFAASSARLLRLAEVEQVVSRDAAGAPAHLGEAGKWTWKAIGTLSCGAAYQLLRAGVARLHMLDGELVRYLPLPAEYANDRWNLDGEISWWEGVAGLWQRCADYRMELVDAWTLHKGKYDPPIFFDTVRDQLAAMIEGTAAPDSAHVAAFATELVGWAGLTVATRQPCFRINLAFEAIGAFERAGGVFPARGRDAFCALTAGTDVPTVDHYCGRADIGGFLDTFRPDVWEYRHQRCGAWETADGAGLETPGLDELVALRLKYGENL